MQHDAEPAGDTPYHVEQIPHIRKGKRCAMLTQLNTHKRLADAKTLKQWMQLLIGQLYSPAGHS